MAKSARPMLADEAKEAASELLVITHSLRVLLGACLKVFNEFAHSLEYMYFPPFTSFYQN